MAEDLGEELSEAMKNLREVLEEDARETSLLYERTQNFLRTPEGKRAVQDEAGRRITEKMTAAGFVKGVEWELEPDQVYLSLESAMLLLEALARQDGSMPSRDEMRKPWAALYSAITGAVMKLVANP